VAARDGLSSATDICGISGFGLDCAARRRGSTHYNGCIPATGSIVQGGAHHDYQFCYVDLAAECARFLRGPLATIELDPRCPRHCLKGGSAGNSLPFTSIKRPRAHREPW